MINLLLDTNVLWWMFYEPDKLRPAIKSLLEEVRSTLYFSPLSVAELIIKHRTGKLRFNEEELLNTLEASDLRELHLRSRHAARTAKLPPLHKDPFDRLIIAQAMEENMTLVSSDGVFASYYAFVIQA